MQLSGRIRRLHNLILNNKDNKLVTIKYHSSEDKKSTREDALIECMNSVKYKEPYIRGIECEDQEEPFPSFANAILNILDNKNK